MSINSAGVIEEQQQKYNTSKNNLCNSIMSDREHCWQMQAGVSMLFACRKG